MISDVTITYNNKDGLIRTLESFLKQTNTSFEVIVVDGGSNDGSLEVLKDYTFKFETKHIPYRFVSEKDDGRYDAMNKGINLAEGEWVCFINAGDCLTSESVIEEVTKELTQDFDIIYGDNRWVDENRSVYHSASDKVDGIIKGLPFSHQSVFVKTELFMQRLYDSELKISGDYEWFLGAYIENKKFRHISLCVSDFYLDGISSYNRYDTYKEVLKIRDRYDVGDRVIVRCVKTIVWRMIDLFRIDNYKIMKKL